MRYSYQNEADPTPVAVKPEYPEVGGGWTTIRVSKATIAAIRAMGKSGENPDVILKRELGSNAQTSLE